MIRILVILCVGFSYLAWANQEDANESVNPLCEQIYEQQPRAILFCTDDRMYLNPEMIFPTTEGLFLGDNYSSIAIPQLLADSSGCYLALSSGPGPNDDTRYYVCRNKDCVENGKIRYGGTSRCPTCSKSSNNKYWVCWKEDCKDYGKVRRTNSSKCPKCGTESSPSLLASN